MGEFNKASFVFFVLMILVVSLSFGLAYLIVWLIEQLK